MTIMIPAWVNGTLQPVEKLEAHQKGLRHLAVSVFVMSRGKVLIQQRAMGKYHTPGLWANTCCTHPAWNEDPAKCAVRRLDEELGIKGLHPAYREKVEYRADVGNGLTEHEVVEIFVAEAPDDLTLGLNPEEVMAVRWVNYYDLSADVARHPENYTPWLQIYLAKHTDAILGEMARTG
ncbi:isopentenyl-diphosphate Delta-isomerase [Yoonia sp. R2331]|uniref:isopentenyl-diphosphate Delta-isomerase n=1 Tax=Yoonia sp. R2331 TaxID=3237238 RepID=UPI0034E4AAC5